MARSELSTTFEQVDKFYTFLMLCINDLWTINYLSCFVSWAALRSSCMFLVICSVLQMTSSVHGRVASSSPSSPGSTASEAGTGLLQMKRKWFTAHSQRQRFIYFTLTGKQRFWKNWRCCSNPYQARFHFKYGPCILMTGSEEKYDSLW